MTELHDRPFASRMSFAFMADALYDFNDCEPAWGFGMTTFRFPGQEDKIEVADYTMMWRRIESLYRQMEDDNGVQVSELSTTEFSNYCSRAAQLGFTYYGQTVSREQVMRKAAAWSKRGWFRFEEKRAENLGKAKKVAMLCGVIGLGMFGIPMPENA